MYATWTATTWAKVGLDIVHMQAVCGKHYLVVVRDDFSSWVKARALGKADLKRVAGFI